MNNHLKISIVVPTRNRADTLEYCLHTILNQNDDNFEIVISDNSTDDLTKRLVDSFSDSRIIYTKSPALLSMTDNWNYAYQSVTGDYVIYIGDDDGLTVGGLASLRKAISANPAEAYKWNTTEYQWPIDTRDAEIVSLAKKIKTNKTINLHKYAAFVMRNGGWMYYRLPGVYHASIKKDVLDKIKAHNDGKLFLTTQPDLFAAMAVPHFVKHFVKMADEVTIQGRSAKSNGGSGVAKNGAKNVQKYVDEFGDYEVQTEVGALWPSLQNLALFIEPFVLANRLFSVYDNVPFNFSNMWAFAVRIGIVNHNYVKKNAKHILPDQSFSYLKFVLSHWAHSMIKYRRVLLTKKYSSKNLEANLPTNIHEFSKYLDR
ncbi:glycosyltransferase [Planktomarina temperata]|nr:glycosyltransferase [Planktomarina temperata]